MLLGLRSRTAISKYENLENDPGVDTLIGSEFVFGEPARRLFPGLYATVELGVTQRAAQFAELIASLETKRAAATRELLEAIARRAASGQPWI